MMIQPTRRDFLKLCTLGSAAMLWSDAIRAGEAVGGNKKPNVLFIFADQYRADVCSTYGGKVITTPHIDRLASEGIVFERGLTTCPLCTPYRGMLMTGKFPTHSGVIANFFETSTKQNPTCIADVFNGAGYETGFIGKWHLAASKLKHVDKHQPGGKGELKGPDCEFVPPGPTRLGFKYWAAYNFHSAYNHYWYFGDTPLKLTSDKYETEAQTDQAIDYMRTHRNSGKPFFLVVAPHPPHPPFNIPPAGYLEKIPTTIARSPNVPDKNPRSVAELRGYYAMAKHVDDCVGKMLKFLDDSGLAESTIVVFTSDHGEMHGSHGRINKMVPYTEAVNVPVVMRWKGTIPAGKRTTVLQTPVDHFPTLCGLAGVKIESAVAGKLDGIDLSPVILGKGAVERKEVLMANYTSQWDSLQGGSKWPEWRGVHSGQYTYVKWLHGKEELYDNEKDRYQMTNLVDDEKCKDALTQLRGSLKDLLAKAHDESLPGDKYGDWFDNERNLIKTGLGPVGS